MAENTLTGLIPDAFQAMDIVSRELTGLIPAVTLNASADRVAVGQNITTHVAPAAAAENATPATTPPDTGEQTIAPKSLTIAKSRVVPFRWTGDGQMSITSSGGPGYANVRADQIAQAIRTLVNEVEADLAALYTKFSRAYGAANATPFASTLADSANLRKILVDNGAPMADLHLVHNTVVGAQLRTLAQLSQVNTSGDQTLLRQGVLLPLHGMDIRESAQIKTHTAGTAANATTGTAGYAVGTQTIALASAGTGTLVAGDCITFANDDNIYVVETGDTDVSNGGSIKLRAPGLRQALPASAVAITVVAAHSCGMAFHRSAIHLAARVPAVPQEGDMASDRTVLVDPRSGLALEFAMYPQYRRVRYEVGLAWGCEVMKTEFTAISVAKP